MIGNGNKSGVREPNKPKDELERWARLNLSLSTFATFLFAHSVARPHVASVPLSILGSEQGHVLILLQILNMYRIVRYHPVVFASWFGKIALGVNAWSFAMLLNQLWDAMGARRSFTEAIQKQGIKPRAGTSSGYMYYILSLLPLMAVARRGKPLLYTQNVPYADLAKVDANLLTKWKQTNPILKSLNMFITRGRISQWLSLDIIRLEGSVSHDAGQKRPILMNIHGGAWVIGDKKYYGLSSVLRLASRGIIMVTINYRMSPECSFPTQIIDCKRALIYVKQHAAEWGGDANLVFVCGESAGGHLSALLGCTPNLPEFQPPESPSEDTSVAGSLPLYGIFDISGEDTEGLTKQAILMRTGRRRYFSKTIVRQEFTPETKRIFDLASPVFHVNQALEGKSDGRNLCPYFITHGTLDVLASFHDAKVFYDKVQTLRQKHGSWKEGESDVFVKVDSGMHGFGALPAIRAHALADAMADFIFHHTARLQGSNTAFQGGTSTL